MPSYAPTSSSKIQFGPEATNGTAVAATKIWRGPATDIVDDSTIKRPGLEENIGLMLPNDRSYKSQTAATLALPSTEATFEQLPYVFEGSIAKVTPTGTTDYTRVYAPSLAGVNPIRTLTWETGNVIGGDVSEMEYSYCEGWTLSGKSGEAWMLSRNNWRGRQKTLTTFTAALSVTAVEEMLFGNTTLAIDASGGTLGATVIAGVLIEASIAYDSGIRAIYSADNRLSFTTHKLTPPKLTYSLKFELESGGLAAAQRAAWAAQSTQLFQLVISGAGNSECTISWAGKHDVPGSYEDDDGDVTIQFKGNAYYNSTAALFLSIDHINQVATL